MIKLDYHIFKGMVNAFLSPWVGGKGRPTFFNIDQTFPALNEVTRQYPVIREEFEAILRRQPRFQRYQDIDPGEAKITSANPEKNWNVFMLYILGHKPEVNRVHCPKTCAILDRIPNVIQAFFSILDPGKSVPGHEGPYYGYLRYHLGLRVPKRNPPKLIVNGQEYVWREGEGVLFDDSHWHEVVNQSDEMRAVLIVDVLRPMPWLPALTNRFITNVVARHTYGRSVARRIRKAA
ncbi:MAG: aspartyl/asparaginyl beta-hydroxylase domain-containing protein [Gemmataceae bacterium]|nr:aspartyl/asparaginyl beta-hydroxylase domain-containing protein [Gemmataceae bacterium]MDW8265854.1 aspartyl/asparaginyl beta-hydroxylase domain-containing protein [Gemmataceae bacterium]